MPGPVTIISKTPVIPHDLVKRSTSSNAWYNEARAIASAKSNPLLAARLLDACGAQIFLDSKSSNFPRGCLEPCDTFAGEVLRRSASACGARAQGTELQVDPFMPWGYSLSHCLFFEAGILTHALLDQTNTKLYFSGGSMVQSISTLK